MGKNIAAIFFAIASFFVFVNAGYSQDDFDTCLFKAVKKASPDTTIGELTAQCREHYPDRQPNESGTQDSEDNGQGYAFSDRIKEDDGNILRPFSLMAHKPNYVLLGTYNSNGYDPTLYQEQYDDPSLSVQDFESQFQLSVKFQLLVDLFERKIDIFAAYTNLSFWQVYNSELSSPFREINNPPPRGVDCLFTRKMFTGKPVNSS